MLWAALATIYVVWGSTYLAIRVMVETMPPLLAAGVRFAIAGALMWLILRLRRGPAAMRVTRRELAFAGLAGVLLCFGGNGLVTVAEQDVPSGLAALLIGAVPLIVVLFRLGERDRPPLATLAGVGVGFVGLAILVLPGDRPGDAPLWGVLTLLAAALLWATGSYYSGRMTLPRDALLSTSLQMMLGGGSMLLAALPAGEYADLDVGRFSGDSWLALAYLIVVGAMLAYTAYTWLLQNAPISTVATYAFVNPVIAVVLGWAILDEEITVAVVAGTILIVASVASVVRRESGLPRRAARARGEPEPEPARP